MIDGEPSIWAKAGAISLCSAILADTLKNRDADTVRIEFFSQKEKETRENLRNGTAAVLRMKNRRRAIRANMIRKRTCSMCGKTAPNSSPSFAYCGGCRNSGVARIDLPRYCSEACQHAHWLAGHKDECPCVHENNEIVDGNSWLEQLARERAKRRK